MNLLFLLLWCLGIILCSVAVPRPRHPHKIYPTDNSQSTCLKDDDATSLDILEKKLLNPKKPSLNKRSNINSCCAAFGNQSPLCQTRRRLKKSPRYNKRLFLSKRKYPRALKSENTLSTTVEDFFGLFTTSSTIESSSKTKTTSLKEPTNYSEFVVSSTNTNEINETNETNTNDERTSSTVSVGVTQKSTKESQFHSSSAESNKSLTTFRTRLLPASMTKLQADSKLLFLDQLESPKNYIRRFYKQEGNEEDDDNGVSEKELGEESSDGTTKSNTEETTNYVFTSKVSVLDTSNHEKTKCELENNKKCVCSFVSLYNDMRTIFLKAKNPKAALQEIAHLQCRYYAPKPDKFELTSHIKPKVLSANKKPMAVDEGKGPKEIEQMSLDKFIAESSSEEDDVIHVFVNTDIRIPCFPTTDVHLSASDADHVRYKWTYGNKKAITEGRMTENSDGEGTLYIEEVSLTDTENYTCEVEYVNPDTGHYTEETFTHVVNVVSLPVVTVRVTVHYRAAVSCDASTMELFQLYLPQQMETVICDTGGPHHLCTVEVHSPVCHSETSEPGQDRPQREVSKKKSFWIRQKREEWMEMSLNLEVYIHRMAEKSLSSENSSLCDARCHLVTTFKLLQLLRESLREVVLTPVSSKVDHGGEFNPIKSSVKIKYIFGCIGGYHLFHGFCVACPKHTYSEDGATECSECPPHTYMGSMGARSCIPCTYAWTPMCNEYFESANLTMIATVIAVLLAVVIVCGLWYMISVKQTKFTDLVKKLTPRKEKTRKVKFGKSQKSMKKKVLSQEELELMTLLDSSTDQSTAEEGDEDDEEEEEAVIGTNKISRSKKRRERKKKLFAAKTDDSETEGTKL